MNLRINSLINRLLCIINMYNFSHIRIKHKIYILAQLVKEYDYIEMKNNLMSLLEIIVDTNNIGHDFLSTFCDLINEFLDDEAKKDNDINALVETFNRICI